MSGYYRNDNPRDNWQTPPEVLDLVREVGVIELDPCTTEDNPTAAEWALTPESTPDGLETPWRPYVNGPFGFAYVNPPYRKPWYDKLAAEMTAGTPLIALIMAKPGAGYFQELAKLAHATCFWRGRITFVGAPSVAPFESALLYHGPKPGKFRAVFGKVGWCV